MGVCVSRKFSGCFCTNLQLHSLLTFCWAQFVYVLCARNKDPNRFDKVSCGDAECGTEKVLIAKDCEFYWDICVNDNGNCCFQCNAYVFYKYHCTWLLCCWIKSHERFSHTWLGFQKENGMQREKCSYPRRRAECQTKREREKICFLRWITSMLRFVLKSIYMLITWQHFIILFSITDKCAPSSNVAYHTYYIYAYRSGLITI